VSQQLIPTGERSGLWTHIATTERGFVVHAEEELTAFQELVNCFASSRRKLRMYSSKAMAEAPV
jgi:hypothetical protein